MSEFISQFDNSLSIALDAQLNDARYSEALQTVQDNRYRNSLKSNCSDTVSVLAKHLTDENFYEKPQLYETCENLLKIVAEHSKEEEALLEFLEIVESTKSDQVFTTALKALQICLRRQKERKARSLEWALNSILSYVSELPCSEEIKSKSDEEENRLLEENDEVRRILTNYLTLFLFYEPIVEDVVAKKSVQQFRNVDINRKNVLTSFVLQLLGPLYFLDLSHPEDKSFTNTYSWQCATTIVGHFSKLCSDPFFLFEYVERRIRWPIKIFKRSAIDDGGVYEEAPKDIFALAEKTPSTALTIFYYLIYAERLMPTTVPQVYSRLYQFEMVLYLAAEMFKTNEHSLHHKTLKLCHHMLDMFGSDRIPVHSLDLNVHETFCTQLIRMLTQTPIKRNSQQGGQLFRKYIFQFDDNGRMFLVKNLVKMIDHNGLYGYVTAMYKDMIAEALNSLDNQLSARFSGAEFQQMMLQYICVLRKGAETDLLQNSDQIITALNTIRFLSLRDRDNRTSFWDIVDRLNEQFLLPLRTGLDMTKAHYRMEERRVLDGTDEDGVEVGVALTSGEELPQITKEGKLKMLASAINTFDLMESLMSRVNECVRNVPA